MLRGLACAPELWPDAIWDQWTWQERSAPAVAQGRQAACRSTSLGGRGLGGRADCGLPAPQAAIWRVEVPTGGASSCGNWSTYWTGGTIRPLAALEGWPVSSRGGHRVWPCFHLAFRWLHTGFHWEAVRVVRFPLVCYCGFDNCGWRTEGQGPGILGEALANAVCLLVILALSVVTFLSMTFFFF